MSERSPASTKKMHVIDIARARSGDKADILNIGVIADDEAAYRRLKEQLTAAVVADHLDGLIDGDITRYPMPNICGFNFVATEALDGGGQVSIRYDTQGKTYAAAILQIELPAWNPNNSGTGT